MKKAREGTDTNTGACIEIGISRDAFPEKIPKNTMD